MSEKTKGQELKEKLFINRKNALLDADEQTIKSAYDFCEDYKVYLDNGKTEREAIEISIEYAKSHGFVPFKEGEKYKAGDRVYFNNRGKTVAFVVIGQEDIEKGANITAAHVDSPRIDLKPNPLYEEIDLALFKTHYYGGVKKYQWTTVPLALHGVFAKKDGTTVKVLIGEKDSDPKFVINDILPHLAASQAERKMGEVIKGEELNVLIGSMPFKDDKESNLVKLNIMNILFEKYGVTEEDFLSAELELVPAYKACDIGLDRSMVGSYGQDDRVCAYPALKAIVDIENPKRTAIAILVDKEEIGSEGNTGLKSAFLKYIVGDIARMQGGEVSLALRNSISLSADVNAAMDPTFQEPFEKNNSAFLNRGVCLTKYTGSRGKSGTSDASAEFVASIRKLFDDTGVVWQMGELGKVDAGGGGTVAMYIANLGIDVVDVGVPVLSMHAPFEVTSKFDVYMCYKAMHSFQK